ncbi:MAG: thioredoxin domain-containing protein [Deltaproteobacteria bacterium]|nr:thioredoxin domain-containing protein [Deltaproteobacteria bacterium]
MKKLIYSLFLGLSLTLSFILSSGAYADTSSVSCEGDPNKIAAEVFGRKITEAELHQALSVDLYELQSNIFELKKRKIEEMVGKIVLEKEAARRKMSVNELLEREVQRNVKKVSNKDIDKFYEQQKEHLKGTKEQYEERIRNFLQNEHQKEAYEKYVERLKKTARAQVYLEKPERPRVTLNLTPAPLKGGENAKVKIVEFSDFECPFCGGLTKTVDKVLKKYGRAVNLTFKAFPLSRHANAVLAHQASLCAHDQGKFWPFHDKLFENQQNLQRADLEKYAENLKLDLAKFKQCLDSGEKFAKIQKELLEGQEAGVRSTPTLFINGKIVVGNVPQKAIEDVVNEELAKK